MQQSIRILCDIYNFIGEQEEAGSINLQSIQEFRQIFLLVGEFINNGCVDPRNIFEDLSLFISKEEEMFGPRKFRKMIENLSSIIVEFVAKRLRAGSTELAVLTLTYYHRYCHRHFTLPIRTLLILLHTYAHFRKNTVEIAERHIAQAKLVLKALEKEGEVAFAAQVRVLIQLLQGMACLRKENFIRAKFIFSQIVNTLTQRIHNEQLRRQLTFETASFFTVATYFLGEAYQGIGQHDRAAYHTTQCMEFASAHLPHHHSLSMQITATHHFANTSVKLGRTQNKIQRIKSLHQFISRPLRAASKENGRGQQLKINKKAKQLEGKVREQLQNILILEEGNEGRLKKKTLKELQAEKQQKQRKIDLFQQQILNFKQEKDAIAIKYPNEQQQSQIDQKRSEMQAIKGQISNKVWEVVGTLKPTHRIQAYLTGFAFAITYQKTNNFIKFLYNHVSFSSHLRLYSILRKVRSKLIRIAIKQVRICSVLHQIQLSKHKVNGSYHMKVYQIEKGPGINEERELSNEVFESLKSEPFYLSFQVQNGKMISLKEHLESLNQCLLARVRLFFLKLRKKVQMRRNQMMLMKRQVKIAFGTIYDQLKYLLFIRTQGNGDGTYTHVIQRIDTRFHFNPDYDIRFYRTVIAKQRQISLQALSQLVTESILQEKAKHTWLITRIQQIFRMKLAKKQLNQLKDHSQVMTTIIRRTIYTLTLTSNARTFFIEHLDGKFSRVRVSNPHFFNLSFLHKIRSELVASEDCGEQLEAINKFFRLRNFAYKFIKKSQEVKLDTKFSTKFKKSLCFAKVMKQYLYRGKLIEGKMMYMLTVKNFQAFPRPYLLRVFTIQHKSLYCVDCELLIYNTEKIYLQHNLQRISHYLDIQDHKKVTILDGPYNPNTAKLKRQNSKSTLVNNYSFGSSQQFLRERGSRLAGRLTHQRDSQLNPNPNRNKKNSINFKMRHKSALKQKDILLIKKWIEDSKEDSSISESEQSSAD